MPRRRLGQGRGAATRPVHQVSDAQQVLAEVFLSTVQGYLRGLMADLKAYTITEILPSMERTRSVGGGGAGGRQTQRHRA